MHQLSGLDALFLHMETNACPMHVGGVAILDLNDAPENYGFETVRAHIESRLDLIPPLRRRLLETPLGLDHPYWIEDPDFDLDLHVRHRALPRPGNDAQLAEVVCELASLRLDRSRPLWEMHYVEGLKGNRAALLTKMHHAAIDGVSGAEILSNLLDASKTPRTFDPPESPWQPDKVPSMLSMALTSAKSLAGRPADLIRLARDTLPELLAGGKDELARRRAARSATGGSRRSGMLAPRTRFNIGITARRSYAFGSMALADVKVVKNAFGVSVNDVVLAICAEALREYLEDHDELPEQPLLAGVPVSVRSESQKGAAGNQVKFTRCSLATDIADPVERLMHIHEELERFKQAQQAVPANRMGDWAELPSPALAARAMRLYENFSVHDYINPPFNTVISNVPGPPVPIYLAGAQVLASYPVSIPYHGLGFNITVMSYQGKLDFGLTAHRGTVPDVDKILKGMGQALSTLVARSAKAA